MQQAWNDFKDFLRTQLFSGILVSVGTFIVQWRMGMFETIEQIKANAVSVLLPYGGIALVFLVGNIGRTLYVRDRDELRSKRRAQRRREHREEVERDRILGPKPNLQCGKIEVLPVDIDSSGYHLAIPGISGSTGLILTITNKVPASNRVTNINDVTAKLYFLSKGGELLDTVEKACWTKGHPAYFTVGGENHLVLLFNEKYERAPRALDRVHGPIIKRRLAENVLVILVSLTSPSPVYNKRFHIDIEDDRVTVCKGASCSICENYILRRDDETCSQLV